MRPPARAGGLCGLSPLPGLEEGTVLTYSQDKTVYSVHDADYTEAADSALNADRVQNAGLAQDESLAVCWKRLTLLCGTGFQPV